MANRRRSGSGRKQPAAQSSASSTKPPTSSGRRTTVVLGAGADVAYGLPTVATLLPELGQFAKTDGRPISDALRKQLPYLRFSFDKLAGDKTDSFLGNLFGGGSDEVAPLRSAVGKLKASDEYASVGAMAERLCQMAESNSLSGPELAALSSLAGTSSDMGDAEPLLDPRSITLTELPMAAMRSTFHRALVEGPTLTEAERDALALFIASISNVEELLSQYFTLFWAGRPSDQKAYLYLVWMLWAFLQTRTAGRLQLERSIQSRLPTIAQSVVTFNYTNFFHKQTMPTVRFFHGRLDQVLHMDDRTLHPVTGLGTSNPESIAKYVASLRLDIRQGLALDIPAIVPPISFKPVMSRDQLRTWATVDDDLQKADIIVVVGYSFALADEHFNCLLRSSKARILVVNPNLGQVVTAAARVLGLSTDQLSEKEVDGHSVRASHRLTGVGVPAELVDIALIERCLE
jgi:hypothetical protein